MKWDARKLCFNTNQHFRVKQMAKNNFEESNHHVILVPAN